MNGGAGRRPTGRIVTATGSLRRTRGAPENKALLDFKQ